MWLFIVKHNFIMLHSPFNLRQDLKDLISVQFLLWLQDGSGHIMSRLMRFSQSCNLWLIKGWFGFVGWSDGRSVWAAGYECCGTLLDPYQSLPLKRVGWVPLKHTKMNLISAHLRVVSSVTVHLKIEQNWEVCSFILWFLVESMWTPLQNRAHVVYL